MSEAPLLFEVKDGVAYVTLNRPTKLNALNSAMLQALDESFDRIAQDEQILMVVLRANGRAFTAGFDLKENIANPKLTLAARRADTAYETNLFMKIWQIPKPFICQVQGYCLGGGMMFACLSDFVVAGESAQFGEPEIRAGFMPSMWVLPWVVGMKKAKELGMRGQLIDAREAERIGLVNRVVPDAELEAEVERWLADLKQAPPMALSLTKEAYNRNYELQGFLTAQSYAQQYFNQLRLSTPYGQGQMAEKFKS